MPAPILDLALVAHVVCAVVGFGSIGVGALSARRGLTSDSPFSEERLRRFYKAGVDWPAHLIFLVPVFGIFLVVAAPHGPVDRLFPWLGLGIWIVAAAVLIWRLRPAERKAQQELAAALAGSPADHLTSFRDACSRMERAGKIVTVCFVLALVVMIWQPA